ncbi:hypothetical protein [Nonomuraea sediminis]|uniref:hypothetical protein n=1 Tax=Nonomuraea sediminis TaxID=2835864 RepID=UPI001BDC1342|nr:hypothetical protein [Nonomuraea sediminis]
MNLPDLPPEIARVQDITGFAAFLEFMARDFAEDQAECERERDAGNKYYEGRWSSTYIGDFLEAWAAWLRDGCIRDGAPFRGDVEPLTWQGLALQIRAGSMYE